MDNIQPYMHKYYHMALAYAPRIAMVIIVFAIGLWLIGLLGKILGKAMDKRHLDTSLKSFLLSLVNVSLKILLLVTVAGMLGLQTTSFVAVLGAAGLAVGLALQGSLANFAGGTLILVFKPFKVGDLIESQGSFGEVQEIQIFNTVVLTPENKTAIIPNGVLSNGVIINHSRHGNLRVDITIGVAPENDVQKVREVATRVMNDFDKVLKTPAPSVNILKMGDGMITLTVRPYATPADYWDVYFGVQEKINTAFAQNNVTAPIPHRVIISK
jgi:small conductance mechanosensitive channel